MKKLFLIPLALLSTSLSLLAQLKVQTDGSTILKSGTFSVSNPAILYLGDPNHFIKSTPAFGVSIGTYQIPNGINLREISGNIGLGITEPLSKVHITGYTTRVLKLHSNIGGIGSSADLEFLTYGTGQGAIARISAVDQGYYNGDLRFFLNNNSGPNSDAYIEVLRLGADNHAYFRGNVYGNANWVFSDKKLKTNIKVCENALDKILGLRGVNYNMQDSMDIDGFEPVSNLKIDTTKNRNPYAKKNYNKVVKKVAYGKNMQSKTQYGFIAQEVEKVFPDLVSTVTGGLKAVNYTGIIPVLVEAFKTQNATIDALKAQNLKLEARIAKLEKGKTSTSNARTATDIQDTETDTKTNSIASDLVKTAYLYQNTPNPFSQETQIKYYVTETNVNTFVSVTDLSGKQVKLLPITTKGEGFVSIKANELYAGLFIYTLVVDGNIIDSKRMMVVE